MLRFAGAVAPRETDDGVCERPVRARKNGYTDGTNAVVTPSQNATNPRQLDVTAP
jgi:hypothetical protein